jgi:hypothetical protein
MKKSLRTYNPKNKIVDDKNLPPQYMVTEGVVF